jgi:hypothetical protein
MAVRYKELVDLYNGFNKVGPPPRGFHLKMETDPVSDTLSWPILNIILNYDSRALNSVQETFNLDQEFH